MTQMELAKAIYKGLKAQKVCEFGWEPMWEIDVIPDADAPFTVAFDGEFDIMKLAQFVMDNVEQS